MPSSFRILRQLLVAAGGRGHRRDQPPDLHAQIPPGRIAQAKAAAAALGDEVWTKFPFVARHAPVADDPVELILNRTWRPALAVTGVDGAAADPRTPATCCGRSRRAKL